jgi:xylulose-5-phosphate/fructose-6-phosphate phosphoketolase
MPHVLYAAQIFLQSNFQLTEPLTFEDVKPRLLGHWGTCHGINAFYSNIHAYRPDTKFLIGPGHGFPALQAQLYLDGVLAKYDPQATLDADGLAYVCRNFSWPYGFPSHASPFTPGVILEGGELGYSLGQAYGAALNRPDDFIAVLIGDGEMETATLLASLNLNKLIKLDGKTNARVLPVLHLNSYKISAPTIYAAISDFELASLLRGFGYDPIFINGDDIPEFQTALRTAETLDYPFIIMRTPKGETGPAYVDGHKVAGNYLSHQVPLPEAKSNIDQLEMLQDWLASYKVDRDELFSESQGSDTNTSDATVSFNPVVTGFSRPLARGSRLSSAISVSDLEIHQINAPGDNFGSSAKTFGELLARDLESDPDLFVFSPDETSSNKIDAIYRASPRVWQRPHRSWEENLAPAGQILELLSENTLFAAQVGHNLSGGRGLMASYESFFNVTSSQIDQYIKFLAQAAQVEWHHDVPPLNLLSTSTCWRQDHNGYSHQNPTLITSVLAKPNRFVNALFPIDTQATIAAYEFANRTTNVVNLTTLNKTDEPQWIDINHARYQYANGGASIFQFASDDEPDIVLTSAGDIVSRELLYASQIVRRDLPQLKLRFVGITALSYDAIGTVDNPLTQAKFDELFTASAPVVASFHGYPDTLRSCLEAYARYSADDVARDLRCVGYTEQGSTTTPFDMLARNRADRYNLAISIFTVAAKLGIITEKELADLRDKYLAKLAANTEYIKQFGIDQEEITSWKWNQLPN